MENEMIVNQWRDELKLRLPTLSKPEANSLALWSIGMVKAQRSAMPSVSLKLGLWLDASPNTIRQRLREFYLPAHNKRGPGRVDLDVAPCFPYLAAWTVSLLSDDKIILALDASTCRDDLTVLCASILVAGSAIPIAWRILPGNQPDHWKDHWLHLLGILKESLGEAKDVIVTTDMGLWAPWLFEAIRNNGWHPLMRVDPRDEKAPHYFKADGEDWQALVEFAPPQGSQQCFSGVAFKKRSLPCHLVTLFGEQANEPWFLLTDSTMDEGQLYRLRYWIEHQFRLIKSDGWDWEHSKIKNWDRAERLWLAYAVGLLWTQSFGSHSEEDDLFDEGLSSEQTESSASPPSRVISVFKKGMALLANAIEKGLNILCPSFAPQPFSAFDAILSTS